LSWYEFGLHKFSFAPEKLPGARCGDGKACRVKILKKRFLKKLCGGVFPERPRKTEQGRVREEKIGTLKDDIYRHLD
jgi:hypothetical protein